MLISNCYWCSDDVKRHGFSVIIDMRGSTWHSVKPFLRVLQVRDAFLIGYNNFVGFCTHCF